MEITLEMNLPPLSGVFILEKLGVGVKNLSKCLVAIVSFHKYRKLIFLKRFSIPIICFQGNDMHPLYSCLILLPTLI
jgi:hypothetical protein